MATKDDGIEHFVEREDLLYRCSELFYAEHLTKREIAQRLNVSATHVKRLLEEAKDKGIVEIEVKLAGRYRRLERDLARKFDLRFARVVETHSEYDVIKTNLAQAAVSCLEAYIEPRTRTKVGIGGGSSLFRMVELLEKKPRPIDIYPLSLFARGPMVEFYSSAFIAMFLLTKCLPIATGYVAGVPPMPASRQSAARFRNWLLNEFPEIRHVYEGSKTVELAFVGLGAAIPSVDIFGEFSKLGYTFEYMQEHGAAGGINYNYFDNAGQQIGQGLLTLSVDELRAMSQDPAKTIVLVGGGSHKEQSVEIVLRTRMVNAIITDEDIARYLLRRNA